MEGRYPPGIYINLADCTDPEKEAEFNRWQNEVYIPDFESLWFVRNSRRYQTVLSESEGPSKPGEGPKYLVLHELWRDDLDQALTELRMYDLFELKAARGHRFANASSMLDAVYRRIGPVFRTERNDRPVRGVHCVLYYCKDPSREAGYNKWMNEKHVPDILNTGLYHTTYRYYLVDTMTTNGPKIARPAYLHLYETDLDPREAYEGLVAHRPWPSDGWELGDVLVAMTYQCIYPSPSSD